MKEVDISINEVYNPEVDIGTSFYREVSYTEYTGGLCRQRSDGLMQRHGAEVTLITEIGPVIGSHAGPGTLAIFFIGKHR